LKCLTFPVTSSKSWIRAVAAIWRSASAKPSTLPGSLCRIGKGPLART
jgi:hypothetical protein